ncbi:Hsp20/alpha crystallin family protein [Haloplanus halophilus]|uniref:Hsp20/alpha crystallin family protein n=1 Tax=Haloplanus halophilus TaxID=2949993 RepID=UPI00203C1087|nr:Hsp20/alpha crystallin family protein [Haloplanus sp. GDY1]
MTRRNPFDDIEDLFERMQENFENAARMWDPEDLEGGLPRPAATGMSVDLEDTGEELVLTGDLPGFETEDIDVRVTERTLRIAAERDETTESEEGEYVRRERRHASVSRSIDLPASVDEEGITATYNNGVLTVRMPKAEPDSRGTRIDVN